ncbi:MAG: hypothetical protein P8Y70_15360 [Candidatus Lokiarchaeota archaeon]
MASTLIQRDPNAKILLLNDLSLEFENLSRDNIEKIIDRHIPKPINKEKYQIRFIRNNKKLLKAIKTKIEKKIQK